MAKDKLTDYSATNASNTDVGGVNINEGMLPSDVNNAIREVMTHLKDFAEGTEAVNSIAVGNITVGGTVTATGNIELGDSGGVSTGRVKFGDGDDLQMYFDGTNSVISSENTTDMYVQANNIYLRSSIPGAENGIVIAGDGAVTAYYDNAAKLATTSSGVSVTGGITVSNNIFETAGTASIRPAGTEIVTITNTGDITVKGQGSSRAMMVLQAGSNTSNSQLRFGDQAADSAGRILYDHSSNFMRFDTNEAEKMRLTSAGLLGLGTSAPTQEIHGYSSGGDFSLKLESASSTGTAYTMYKNADQEYAVGLRGSASDTFQIIDFTADATRLTVDTSGNVGINTASPDSNHKLEVASGGTAEAGIRSGNTSEAILNFGRTSDRLRGRIAYNNSSEYMAFWTNQGEKARLDSSGNLLVGKTADNVSTVGIEARATGPLISTRDGSDALRLNRLNSDGEIIQLRKDGTVVGTIGTQNWGIGTASPGRALHVKSSNATVMQVESTNTSIAQMTFVSDGAASNPAIGAVDDTSFYIQTGNFERARFDDSANFLVGATSLNDTNGFTVFPTGSGSATMVRIDRNSNGTALQFRQGQSAIGTVSTTTSGVTYNTTSDIRLKQDIEPLQATDKLMAMNPVSYSWKVDPDGPRSMGFIAQEMQEVMPEAVSTGDDDDAMMSMDYGRITPILVSALQDAHRKIEELAAEIAELKAN